MPALLGISEISFTKNAFARENESSFLMNLQGTKWHVPAITLPCSYSYPCVIRKLSRIKAQAITGF
jgi:hypothetical protein